MINLLINEKPAKLLLALAKQTGNKGINEIGKGCYSTYKSKYLTILELEKLGYASLYRVGREVIAKLTPKGEEAVKHIYFFM